jgi:hypothetical protein
VRECGFDAGYDVDITGERLRATEAAWREQLARTDVRERPDDPTWSPLEYGAHSRDVLRVMRGRLEQMLAEDDAIFESWDQDAAGRDRPAWGETGRHGIPAQTRTPRPSGDGRGVRSACRGVSRRRAPSALSRP